VTPQAVFIIHLARATGRRPQVEKLLKALPIASSIVDAVDGRAIGDSERNAVYRRHLHDPRYPFELVPGELGAFLSHRKAWRRIVDDEISSALIIEDDTELLPQFATFASGIESLVKDGDYLRFPKARRESPVLGIGTLAGHRIFVPRLVGLGASAQIVTHGAARRLLGVTETFDRPVDTFLQMTWLHGVRMLTMLPVVVEERSAGLGGTTIQLGGDSLLRRVEREMLRFNYRRAVRRLAALNHV
jgi:GR25 family glycosyltransferase involved in LPS biosynthesis